MPAVTTRLVTLVPPGAALRGLLDALHGAASAASSSETTVGRPGSVPDLPGQPDGFTLVELTTSPGGGDEHDKFIKAAVRVLSACDVSYAWQRTGGDWNYSQCPGCVGRGTGGLCCACGGSIPAALRRTKDSPEEYDRACPGCRAGRRHAHQAGS